MKRIMIFLELGFLTALFSGCAVLEKAQRTDELRFEIAMMKKSMDKMARENERALEELRRDKDLEIRRLVNEKDEEIAAIRSGCQSEVRRVEENKSREMSSLERAKHDLERRLSKEVNEYKAKLEMTERGLVVTFLSEIFFSPGKDTISTDGERILKNISQVVKQDIPDAQVAVEGHTDNDPIKVSGWKSNWELSAARALAVVHFFVDQCGVLPGRLSAVGHGEFKPVASNDLSQGKQQNRRVEIVILPPKLEKIKRDEDVISD